MKKSLSAGGCSVYRNTEVEEAQIKLLQKKWGSKIVKFDKNQRNHVTKKDKAVIDINPIISVPITGI